MFSGGVGTNIGLKWAKTNSRYWNQMLDLLLCHLHVQDNEKVASTLLKEKLWHRCFPVHFATFLRTSFLQSTSGRLLLSFLIKAKKFFLSIFNILSELTKFFYFLVSSARPWSHKLFTTVRKLVLYEPRMDANYCTKGKHTSISMACNLGLAQDIHMISLVWYEGLIYNQFK